MDGAADVVFASSFREGITILVGLVLVSAVVNVHELVPVRHLHKVGQVELIVCQVVELVLEDILSLGNVEVSTRALLPGNPDAAPLGKGLEPQACLFLEQLHDVEFAVLPGL